MLVVALSPAYVDGGTIASKIAGIVLASLSSGLGELSFVGLTHFYGRFSLAAWGSGTGAAGLVGAGAYALATTSLGLKVKTTLLTSAFLPAFLAISFFLILPRSPIQSGYRGLGDNDGHADENSHGDDGDEEREGLLGSSKHSSRSLKTTPASGLGWHSVKANFQRARGLFFPL
jgi:battenin